MTVGPFSLSFTAVTLVDLLHEKRFFQKVSHFTGKTLLLIDPEDDLREVTQTGLELTTNWKILTAPSYTEGLRLAIAQKPDAILVNGSMIDLEYSAIFNQLDSHPVTENIPIIAISDRVRLGDKVQFAQLGVMDVIAKPFDSANLGQQIATFLQWNASYPSPYD
ncbi:response regulator [Lusitaniella coriacea]|uniref:response regulator n=1 Tax=Lusitaniella coriacea TaxID=1983105 RepID=UPI003CF66B35